MPYLDINYECPYCSVVSPVLVAVHNVIAMHYVAAIDNGYLELGELSDIEYRKSNYGGYYCSACGAFICKDLGNDLERNPEYFTFTKSSETNKD
jgi:hypothetical protein